MTFPVFAQPSEPERDGILRYLPAERLAEIEPLLRQYRVVRAREGYQAKTADDYRALPSVPTDDPHAFEWQIRAESFERLRQSLPRDKGLRVLYLGAGNGWLADL